MKNNRLTPRRERGMTAMGFVLVLIVIGFSALIAMKVLPIYLDYFSIRSTLEGLASEPGVRERSPADITKAIERRFDVSFVTVIKAKDVKIQKKGGAISLILQYEDRRPLLSNLDVVASFDEVIVLGQ